MKDQIEHFLNVKNHNHILTYVCETLKVFFYCLILAVLLYLLRDMLYLYLFLRCSNSNNVAYLLSSMIAEIQNRLQSNDYKNEGFE